MKKSMAEKIRWGIMGLGRIAMKFAADLTLVDGAELVAIGSRDITKARAFAEQFPCAGVYGDYNSLVQDRNVDVIYIATPHSHHHENTLLCLEHGKAVLCEKAFAVNSRQTLEMVELSRKKGLFLMEALWTKFLPHYGQMTQMITAGQLGEIKSVIIDFGFRPAEPVPPRLFDPLLAGGTMLDIGIYNVFMATSILGRPDHIEAFMTPASSGIDEQCAVLFRYNDGAMAQLFSSFSSNLPTEANINGTAGRLKLGHRFYAPESQLEFYPGRFDSRQHIEVIRETAGNGYQYEARHVCECLRSGLTESSVLPLSETIERMEILDAIRVKAGIRYAADIK